MYQWNNRNKTEPAPSGSKIETTYSMKVTKTGHKELEASGEKNVYAIIQESLEETKIENILRRAMLGDESALERVQGQYLDLTETPTSYTDMLNMINKAKEDFESLPAEVKSKFNYSAEEFITSLGTETFNEKMGIKKIEPIVTEEIKSEITLEKEKIGE